MNSHKLYEFTESNEFTKKLPAQIARPTLGSRTVANQTKRSNSLYKMPYVFVVKNDVRKSLFRTLANIFGRQLINVRPDVNPNFKVIIIVII